MNMWAFMPRVFDQLRDSFKHFLEQRGADPKAECLIPSTVGDLVRDGQAKVKVLRTNDAWFGVTYREDRPRVIESVRALITAGVYPEKLWP
jgi:hypothetical protein